VSDQPPTDTGSDEPDDVLPPIAYGDLWARPGFLIRRLHQIHVAIFLEECKTFDVTPVQYAVLSVLYDGAALDQVSVAAEVGIDRNNAADVIRRLERSGLVERLPSESDRRAKLARITGKGREFVRRAHGAMESAQRRFMGSLSKRDADRLIALCRAAQVTAPGRILRNFVQRYGAI